MSKRKENFDQKRGLRFKRFREELLEINQKDFANERSVSQSKMSMIEKGQMPDQALIDFYTENGINWHWIMTGMGNMKAYKINQEEKVKGESFYTISNRLNSISNMDSIEEFFFEIEKFNELYFKLKYSSRMEQNQKKELALKIVNSISDAVVKLKSNYKL